MLAMNERKYELDVLSRVESGLHVPFREVSLGGRPPVEGSCHDNVDEWVRLNPECRAIRGWAANDGNSHTAHSVVKDECGNLFDITVKYGSSLFVRHIGSEEDFRRKVKCKHTIRYPDDLRDRLIAAQLRIFED
ncbi:hypothetical protein [Roseococcus sp.]|uniref:hypothetical protein n=1 Tax=Roseococcus sp. TaxID=2109646 RepID=UPI003BAC71AE